MAIDQSAAAAQREALKSAAMAAGLDEERAKHLLRKLARVVAPTDSNASHAYVTIALSKQPSARSRKPGNITLSWSRMGELLTEAAVAATGANTIPPHTWFLAALHVWYKAQKAATEELTQTEAIAMYLVSKTCTRERGRPEPDLFQDTTNWCRGAGLPTPSEEEFSRVITRLSAVGCIRLHEGLVYLKESVRVRYE